MGGSQKQSTTISVRSFVAAIAVIFILMAAAYLLTILVPGGHYARITDVNGNVVIDTTAGFQYVEGGLPFWKWLASPILVLGVSGGGTLIAVIAFLLVIGGVFYGLEQSGLMTYMLQKTVKRFGGVRYRLMAMLVLIMNFFIPSGSAKAFMLIPLIVPIAQIFGISAQLCVVAFAFGDGFSNVAYPTNPALLISLGLADVSYHDWFRFSVRFQWMNLLLTSGILLLGLAVGY